MPPGGKLEPAEGVDSDGVRSDGADIADHELGPAPREDAPKPLAEPGEVVRSNRPLDGKGDGPRG